MRTIHCVGVGVGLSLFLLLGCETPQQAPIGASALPPSYLMVDGFKQCLETQSMETWTAWCMPSSKPSDCAPASWEALVKISAEGGLTACHRAS